MDWLAGFQNVIALGPLVAILLGVVIGLVFGAVPGLSATMAVALCLLLSTVGFAPTDAVPRFTFGYPNLDAGFALLPVLLGLFAVTEIFKEALTPPDRGTVPKVCFKSPRFPGARLKDLTEHGWNAIRSGAIGVGVGLLPGIGSSASNRLAYSAARSSDKDPERFGPGVASGIVASETANNANVGAAMVPLIALGIPGDSVTAMLLGGLMIHGMQPGPLLFTANGPLVYAVFVALLIANVVILVVSIAGIRLFVRILSVPKSYLLSVVMVTCVLGAFATNNRIFDVYTLVGFGILGLGLSRLSIPFPPLILGFILGPLIEVNLRSALMSSRGELLPFLQRPFSAAFLGLALTYVVIMTALRVRKQVRQRAAPRRIRSS